VQSLQDRRRRRNAWQWNSMLTGNADRSRYRTDLVSVSRHSSEALKGFASGATGCVFMTCYSALAPGRRLPGNAGVPGFLGRLHRPGEPAAGHAPDAGPCHPASRIGAGEALAPRNLFGMAAIAARLTVMGGRLWQPRRAAPRGAAPPCLQGHAEVRAWRRNPTRPTAADPWKAGSGAKPRRLSPRSISATSNPKARRATGPWHRAVGRQRQDSCASSNGATSAESASLPASHRRALHSVRTE